MILIIQRNMRNFDKIRHSYKAKWCNVPLHQDMKCTTILIFFFTAKLKLTETSRTIKFGQNEVKSYHLFS